LVNTQTVVLEMVVLMYMYRFLFRLLEILFRSKIDSEESITNTEQTNFQTSMLHRTQKQLIIFLEGKIQSSNHSD